MSNYMGFETLSEQLTDLLMENGAAVTKPSIDKLVEFIANRDQATMDKVIKDAESQLRQLQYSETFGTQHPTPTKNLNPESEEDK